MAPAEKASIAEDCGNARNSGFLPGRGSQEEQMIIPHVAIEFGALSTSTSCSFMRKSSSVGLLREILTSGGSTDPKVWSTPDVSRIAGVHCRRVSKLKQIESAAIGKLCRPPPAPSQSANEYPPGVPRCSCLGLPWRRRRPLCRYDGAPEQQLWLRFAKTRYERSL